jgi:hypothetical protein
MISSVARRSKKSLWLIPVGLLLLIVAFPVWTLFIHPILANVPEGPYVEKNEQLLASIPIYPRSRFANAYSIGQPNPHVGLNENGPPYSSYNTWHDFRVPAGTSCGRVGAFFRSYFAAGGCERRTGGPDPGDESLFVRHDGAGVDFACLPRDADGLPTYMLNANFKAEAPR